MFFVNISKHIQYFRKRIFAIAVGIFIENKFNLKKILSTFFSNSFLFLFRDFSMVFRRFLREFPIFLETVFSAEIHIERDRICKLRK